LKEIKRIKPILGKLKLAEFYGEVLGHQGPWKHSTVYT